MKILRYSGMGVCFCFFCLFTGMLTPNDARSLTVTEFSYRPNRRL